MAIANVQSSNADRRAVEQESCSNVPQYRRLGRRNDGPIRTGIIRGTGKCRIGDRQTELGHFAIHLLYPSGSPSRRLKAEQHI